MEFNGDSEAFLKAATIDINYLPAELTAAFLFITLAAILRVFAILLLPAYTQAWLALAVACWIAAFGLFLFIYTPILMLPRVDGRQG